VTFLHTASIDHGKYTPTLQTIKNLYFMQLNNEHKVLHE